MSVQQTVTTIGRRKEATARVRLAPGTGKIVVNGVDALKYFTRETLLMQAERGLVITDRRSAYDVTVTAAGGGLSGQAGATRLGIARALTRAEPELKDKLRAEGMLTRDARVTERKKPGQPKARKRFQFSKR